MNNKKIALAMLCALLPGTAALYAWGCMHATITEAAFAVLPEKQKQAWSATEDDAIAKTTGPISRHLIRSFCLYPDSFANPKSPGFLPEAGQYIYADKSKRSYHYFVHTEAQNRALCHAGAKWYFQKMAESFKANKPLDAARYAGAFAHAIEDRVSPFHCLDGYEKVRAEYDQKHGLTFAFWTLDDNGIKLSIEGYQPQRLGATPSEAADEFTRRFEENNLKARTLIQTRFIEAHLKDDWRSKASGQETNEIMREMAEPAARLLADAWFTGFILEPEKTEPKSQRTTPVKIPVPNAGAEDPLDPKIVMHYKSAAATAECTIAEDVSHTGKKSYHIINTSEPAATSQNACWIIKMPAEPDRAYEISAWVRTRDVKKAYIGVRHVDEQGNYVSGVLFAEADAVSGTNDWRQIKTEVVTPVDAKGFNIFLFVADKGEAWFDDIEAQAQVPAADASVPGTVKTQEDNKGKAGDMKAELTDPHKRADAAMQTAKTLYEGGNKNHAVQLLRGIQAYLPDYPPAQEMLGYERHDKRWIPKAAKDIYTKGQIGSTLNVMTFNLLRDLRDDPKWIWEKRQHLIAEIIRDYRPDLIGIQESIDPMLDPLMPTLPEYTLIKMPCEPKLRQETYGGEFIYRTGRFDILDAQLYFFPPAEPVAGQFQEGTKPTVRRGGTLVTLRDKESGKTVCAFSSHVEHSSPPINLASCEMLKKRLLALPPDALIFVMGDFNITRGTPSWKALTAGERALNDPKTLALQKCISGNVNDGIDWLCFYPPDLPALFYAVIRYADGDIQASDHDAVFAQFGLP